MIKKVNNIRYVFLLLLMSIMASCNSDIITDPESNIIIPGSGKKTIPVVLDINGIYPMPANTYGTDYGTAVDVEGSALENAVSDVVVYIFDDSYNCEKIMSKSVLPINPVGPVMVTTGMKHLIVVANGAGKITLPMVESAVSYPALLKMVTDASATLPSSPFLMTGIKNNVPLPDDLPIVSPYSISVDIQRACAKVSISITKSANALSHNIKMQSITLVNGAERVPLFERPSTPYTTYPLTSTKTSFLPSSNVPNTPSYCALADSFYTNESLCGTDKSKGVYFEMKMEVNSPTNIRTAKFYLGEYTELGAVDTSYDIKRNYWYDVKVNIIDPGFDSLYVTVVSCPWNVAASQDTTVGGGYEVKTSLPFKLVKPYTNAELSSGSNGAFAAIEKHTKGESYIDLKVTQGTGWSLDFKSGVAANTGAKMALGSDSANWTSDWGTSLSGIGDGNVHRIWIYRPYVENAEPKAGPSLTLKVGGVEVRDFVVQPRDTTPIPTNCYIMRPQLLGYPVNETRAYIPLAGVYKYWEDELMKNGDSIPAGSVTANISWTDHSGTIVQNVSVLNAGKRDSAYIYAEAGPTQGNAVVDMKVGGVIYWSFHLWVTEYNPYEPAGEKGFNNGHISNVFMDRNLGALKNDYDAVGEARGLYYQFGRKDPFPRGTSWSNTLYSAIATGTAPTASTNLRPKTAIMTMLNNPTRFYTGSWPFYTENNFLWKSDKGNKTAFDPCPEGYRIPVQTTSTNNPWQTLTTLFMYPVENNGRYNDDLGYYPLAGYLNASGTTITGTGTAAYFWTSSASASGGSALNIGATTEGFLYNTQTQNCGYSVRCVVDANYILSGGDAFGSTSGGFDITPIP